MKKNFRVKLLVVGLSLFSLFYLSEDKLVANASDNEKSNAAIPGLKREGFPLEGSKISANERNNTTITPQLRTDLKNLSVTLNTNLFYNQEITFHELMLYENQLEPSNVLERPIASVNNDMVLENGDTLAAHSATLSNQTGTQQTMSTASFAYTETDSVSTATTHATGVSLTTSAEMRFPLVSGSMSMAVNYDFGHTNSVESTVEKQWAVPSQNVVVPAGHHYNINWILNTGVATGTTNLTSSVNADIPYKLIYQHPTNFEVQVMPLGSAIAEQDRLAARPVSHNWDTRSKWERIDGRTALRTWGTSRYKAQFGTELIMQIIDVNNPNAPVKVQEIPMNVMPVRVK